MLTAIIADGKLISLLDEKVRRDIRKLQSEHNFYCPACGGALIVKLGSERIWHFAHDTAANCAAQAEGESQYHMKGKQQLYRYFLSKGYDVSLEPYLSELKQRPDLLLPKRHLAIEFQCATVSRKEIITRTHGYQSSNIRPLWILGEKRMKRTKSSNFRISAFDWTFLFSHKGTPTLLYYCPHTHHLLTLTNVTPFSAQTTIACLTIKSLASNKDEVHFKQKDMLFQRWLHEKKKWRTQAGMFYTPTKHQLAAMLYEQGIVLCYLPAEVGLPLPSLFLIETSAVMWQAWVWVIFLKALPIGSSISLHSIIHHFNLARKKGLFKTRDLPMYSTKHYSFVIEEYLMLLVQLGYYKKISSDAFQKVQCFQQFELLEEAFRADESIMYKVSCVEENVTKNRM